LDKLGVGVLLPECLPPLRHRDISFWWRDCLKNLDLYKEKGSCTMNSGLTVLFWTDLWSCEMLSTKWPYLFTFAKDISISVKNAIATEEYPSLFHLPLSIQAMGEYQQFITLIQETHVSLDKDKWAVTVAAPGYQVSSMYKDLMKQGHVLPIISWLWKTCCQDKHKVFFWLLFHNRLNTRAMLQRKRFFLPDYTCIMCNGSALETRDHLFFPCPFAESCWKYLCPDWDSTLTDGTIVLQDVVQSFKAKIQQPFFMELIMLTSWSIWTIRNDFIFKGIPPSLYRCRHKFKKELSLLMHKAKKKSYIGLRA
jgi:hypothetical protein